VLVDTGVGPPGLWDGWQPEREGGLLPALCERGVAPADVDVVLMTHDHVDHVGWNTDAAGEPVFLNARYLLDEAALARARSRPGTPHVRRCLLAIEDRLETFSGEAEIAPGVVTVPLPGHAEGHVGVRVGDGVLMVADAVPHPALLDHPEWQFLVELDPEQASATRYALVSGLKGERVVGSHFDQWRPVR